MTYLCGCIFPLDIHSFIHIPHPPTKHATQALYPLYTEGNLSTQLQLRCRLQTPRSTAYPDLVAFWHPDLSVFFPAPLSASGCYASKMSGVILPTICNGLVPAWLQGTCDSSAEFILNPNFYIVNDNICVLRDDLLKCHEGQDVHWTTCPCQSQHHWDNCNVEETCYCAAMIETVAAWNIITGRRTVWQITKKLTGYSTPPCFVLLWCHISIIISQITHNLTVCLTAPNRKENIKALHYWPFIRGILWWLIDSLHKGPVMLKMFPYHAVTMGHNLMLSNMIHITPTRKLTMLLQWFPVVLYVPFYSLCSMQFHPCLKHDIFWICLYRPTSFTNI